jgi:hypothetical protein
MEGDARVQREKRGRDVLVEIGRRELWPAESSAFIPEDH